MFPGGGDFPGPVVKPEEQNMDMLSAGNKSNFRAEYGPPLIVRF